MSAEHEINEESIFIAAMELPAAEQAEFIATACGDDLSLRQRIEVLLRANNNDNSWLDEPAYHADGPRTPTQIGRYKIHGTLGEGGFGVVYSGYDDQLDRQVAIKVPHVRFLRSSDDSARQLSEARTIASLDHPNILPVFDVGSDSEFPFYIVTKLVEGNDLTARLRRSPLLMDRAIELVATIAESLHYAHTRGIVHRDVKPANILLDHADRPYLVDFGLALQEQDVRQGPRYSGSPAYMSPEQAQGEGHRVDRRSDIFSLCVVLYELLAGQRPFQGKTQSELLDNIMQCKPASIREHNRSIPRELERICSKGLAMRRLRPLLHCTRTGCRLKAFPCDGHS